jgi:uncharacterized protein (TIGR02118 family)
MEGDMVKLVFCLRRLPRLSREEFQRYWRDVHGPLVRSHAAVLRIRRYVQMHALAHPAAEALRASRSAPAPYDGVAELWWETIEDLVEATGTPEGLAAGRALHEDERRFIDHAASPLWLGHEHPIIP